MKLPISINNYLSEVLSKHGYEVTQYNSWLLINNHLPAWRAFVVELNQYSDTTIAQLDFHILVDQNKEFIIESFAGIGNNYEQAVHNGFENFLYNTFHVINAAFLDPNDNQVTKESWKINGFLWEVILGNYSIRAKETITLPEKLFETIETSLKERELQSNVHWLRVFYGNQGDGNFISEALFDNDPWPNLQQAISKLPWQKSFNYYSVRNFLILKNLNL